MPPGLSPDPAAAPRSGAARRARRAAWMAWRIGWILFAAVSMIVAYGALVIIGR